MVDPKHAAADTPVPDPVGTDPLTFDQAWEITKEINENVRHYNEHQTKYRTLASQWLIAGFAGIGFLFSAEPKLPFDKLIFTMLISVASAFGIFQLWRIDIILFQKIIQSFFSAGAHLEDQFTSLPKIKTSIYKNVPKGNAGETLFQFYFYIITVFLLIGLISFLYIPKTSRFFAGIEFETGCILLYLAALVFIYRYMKDLSKPREQEM